jgi:PAS domain S-box-containing protein
LKSFQMRIKHRVALLVVLLLTLDVMMLFGSTWLISKTEEEAQKSLFGVEANSMIGKHTSTYFVTGELDKNSFWIQLQKTAVGHAVEVTAKTREGKEFAAEVTLSTQKGERKTFLASIANVQEKHELTKLRQAVLAMVSHELRTPLTSIAGFLELITMGKYGDTHTELTKQAAGAQESTGRLIALVNDLLDLEKLESETTKIKKVPCELNTIFNQSLNAVSMIASTRGISITVTPQPCELEVMGDPARLVQVMVNLLANSVKFSADQDEVLVTWSQEKNLVKIAVADKGPGVPSEYQKLIFERFQQVNQPGVHHPGGIGLGLPICKTIVEQHDGTMGVESIVGKGSTFWFTLPCDEEDD